MGKTWMGKTWMGKAWLAKHRHSGLLATFMLTFAACYEPDTLLDDASFDAWCGRKLCSWRVEQGSIKKVATWHDSDYGVELSTPGTIISQVSTRKPDCIHLELIVDIEKRADVQLELDFNADGTVDHSEPLPLGHFEQVELWISAPLRDFEDVKFAIHKRGEGHAVVAQMHAEGTAGGECTGPAVLLGPQNNGARCEAATGCKSEACELRIDVVENDPEFGEDEGDGEPYGVCVAADELDEAFD